MINQANGPKNASVIGAGLALLPEKSMKPVKPNHSKNASTAASSFVNTPTPKPQNPKTP